LGSGRLLPISAVIIILAVFTTLLYFNHEYPSTATHIATNTNTNASPLNTGSRQPETSTNTVEANYTSPHSLNTGTASNTTTAGSHAYKLAVKALKNILKKARDIYLNALEENETWKILIYEPYSNLSKTLILNATIANETTLLVGHTVYKYIVVSVYEAKSKLSFKPQRIQVNGVLVELLPRNKSITYTGIVPYDYLVCYKGRKYRVSFASIGFVEATKHLTASTDKISSNIYKVKITVAEELGGTKYVNEAWLILIRS
jgi:hypothetical protein